MGWSPLPFSQHRQRCVLHRCVEAGGLQPWPSSQHSQETFSLNGLKNPLRRLGGELKGFYFIFRNTSDFCLHIILNLKLVIKRMRIVHCGVFRSKYGHLLG